jgi:hypothetical protein
VVVNVENSSKLLVVWLPLLTENREGLFPISTINRGLMRAKILY